MGVGHDSFGVGDVFNASEGGEEREINGSDGTNCSFSIASPLAVEGLRVLTGLIGVTAGLGADGEVTARVNEASGGRCNRLLGRDLKTLAKTSKSTKAAAAISRRPRGEMPLDGVSRFIEGRGGGGGGGGGGAGRGGGRGRGRGGDAGGGGGGVADCRPCGRTAC
jgi:hypothetical protein